MALSSLPLQVRKGIRDAFDADDATVKESLKTLNTTTGYDMNIQISWVDIWNALQPKFVDSKESFVTSVTDALSRLLDSTNALLESSEEFQETFLEKIGNTRKTVTVEIYEKSAPQTGITREGILTLYLPKWGPSEFRQNMSRIGTDLEDAFSGKARPVDDPIASTTQDDFVEIIGTNKTPARTLVTVLPSAASLPRPDVLFGSTLPYTLIVRNRNDGIDIDCSHAPTLNLIYEYFNRHTRKNMIDHRKPPYFEVKLVQSYWGTGSLHDRVMFTREDNRATSWELMITGILTFVEGVCGYTFLERHGQEWVYRRTEAFR